MVTVTVIEGPLTAHDALAPGSATVTARWQLAKASEPRRSSLLELTPALNWLVSTNSAPDCAPRYAAVSARVELGADHEQVRHRDQQGAKDGGDDQCGEHDHLSFLGSTPAPQHVMPAAHCRNGGTASAASWCRLMGHRQTSPTMLLAKETVPAP